MVSLRTVRRALLAMTGTILAVLTLAAPANADGPAPLSTENVASHQSPHSGADAAGSLSPDYKLGPSDKVRVTVYEEDDLSGEFQIDGAGYVRLPLVGQIQAAGQSVFQLETLVEKALDDGYLRNARVSIEVTEYRPFYIIGEVNKPGEYPYASNMTVLNAVALAGGYTTKAVQSTIYVRHEAEVQERPVVIDQLTRLYPGDVVRVPETSFWTSADVLSPITQVLAPVTSLAYVLKP
jgi:protein involved in polysaccharide export with SLBB domain